MKGYLALIRINLKLAFREKAVLFFNFLFPLLFFFIFGEMLEARQGGVGIRVVSMVLVLGALGSGLFGAGVRAVVERETNILRRYKVAPISPAPILVASIVTGWLLYLPAVVLIVGLARFLYAVQIPERWLSLLVLLSLGACALRALGLIAASVVNSAAENTVLIQLLYMPMLFLSGATFPLSSLPGWAQVLSQFLPASYLHNGMERVMLRGESLAQNLTPVAALAVSTVAATWISMKIFRWEKEEVIGRSAKLWLLAVLAPFLLLGGYQAYSHENVEQSKALEREIRRNRTRLIRGARIFTGDGKVIESGSLLIRDGRIEVVYEGAAPDPESLNAEPLEAAGKTALPGLIDASVRVEATGGLAETDPALGRREMIERHLAAYLYSGVTAVRSVDPPTEVMLEALAREAGDLFVGAELFLGESLFPAARRASLPEANSQAVTAALAAGAEVIEHGSFQDRIPEELLQQMARHGAAYDPTLSVVEAFSEIVSGKADGLSRSLLEQVAPAGMVEATRRALESQAGAEWREKLRRYPFSMAVAQENLRAAYEAGVPLVAGSGAGYPLVLHGPTVQRELQLWVQAGIPASAALQAATYNAARLLGEEDRIGLLRPGYEATLVLVDGNPTEDIAAAERISVVFLQGERMNRPALLEQQR